MEKVLLEFSTMFSAGRLQCEIGNNCAFSWYYNVCYFCQVEDADLVLSLSYKSYKSYLSSQRYLGSCISASLPQLIRDVGVLRWPLHISEIPGRGTGICFKALY